MWEMSVDALKESSRPAARWIAMLSLAFAIALAGLIASGSGTARANFKQPGCAKFKKKLKRTRGKAGKARVRRALKQCKANRKVYNQLRDFRFVGTREDGEPVDLLFCSNGLFADKLDSTYGEIYRKGWRIRDAKFKGKNFTAVYEALIGRSKVGGRVQISTRAGSLARKNGKWQSGTESFGVPGLLGDVTRTKAKKDCNRL